MADLKISQLTSATTPLAGTEVLPIVQSSSTKKVATDDLTVKNVRSNATTGILQVAGPAAAATRVMTVPDANFTAARTDAANSFTGDQTLSTGDLVQGTAAKGINFTANTGAAGKTSQLLNAYEEGTFTPTWNPASGSGATIIIASGWYTRIGNRLFFDLSLATNGVGTSSGALSIGGFPYTSSGNSNQLGGAYCVLQANAGMGGAYTAALRINFNATNAVPIIFSATTGSATMTVADWGVSGSYRFVGSYQIA